MRGIGPRKRQRAQTGLRDLDARRHSRVVTCFATPLSSALLPSLRSLFSLLARFIAPLLALFLAALLLGEKIRPQAIAMRPGKLYIDTHAGALAELDAKTGRMNWGVVYESEVPSSEYWNQPIKSYTAAAPLLAGGILYSKGMRSSRLLALRPEGALEIPGEGPELNATSALVDWFDEPAGPGRTALAVFTSEGCGMCRSLAPAFISATQARPRERCEGFQFTNPAAAPARGGIGSQALCLLFLPKRSRGSTAVQNNWRRLEM